MFNESQRRIRSKVIKGKPEGVLSVNRQSKSSVLDREAKPSVFCFKTIPS